MYGGVDDTMRELSVDIGLLLVAVNFLSPKLVIIEARKSPLT